MAALLVPRLVASVGQQLTQLARYAALPRPASLTLHRFFTSVTVPGTRRTVMATPPGLGVCSQIRAPLLGRCQQLACLQQPVAGMKTKTSLKKRCKECFFVWRRGRLYVYCKTHPRHKQRQG